MKVISTAKLAIGESITATITDIQEGKFGALFTAVVNGETVELRPSGNLRFLADDLANGKKSMNVAYTITRVEDKTGTNKAGKAFTATQFTITEAAKQESVAGNPVAAKLAAIRAKNNR